MADLAKYGVAYTFMIPILKIDDTDFLTTWTPATGDVKVHKNQGSAVNITTLPTYVATGQWKFSLSATEMQAKEILVYINDALAEEQVHRIQTYGHASAAIVGDLDNLDAAISTRSDFDETTDSVDVGSISGDTTAADNLELDYDGTGYNKTNSTIGTATALGTDAVDADALATDAATEISNNLLGQQITAGGVDTIQDMLLAMYSAGRGKVVKTGTNYAYYDDDGTTLLFTLAFGTTDQRNVS
jgi:hypothetical protein